MGFGKGLMEAVIWGEKECWGPVHAKEIFKGNIENSQFPKKLKNFIPFDAI